MPLRQSDIQPLPAFLRKYPEDYGFLERRLLELYGSLRRLGRWRAEN
jgi:hypothetical protein